jgi:hypothetical protein
MRVVSLFVTGVITAANRVLSPDFGRFKDLGRGQCRNEVIGFGCIIS